MHCFALHSSWQALSRFLDDGRLDFDNTLCDRQIRDIAIGRRNYLFAGSHAAARRAAILYSLTRTCAQYGVSPLPYLTRRAAENSRSGGRPLGSTTYSRTAGRPTPPQPRRRPIQTPPRPARTDRDAISQTGLPSALAGHSPTTLDRPDAYFCSAFVISVSDRDAANGFGFLG
jgi:hypothetical protein